VRENLEALELSARAELEAFIERIVPIKIIARRMLRSGTFGYVTAALPGLEAFLMLERLRIMAADCALNDRWLVVDAPASGSALELLSVAAGVGGIAPAGTLNRLAGAVESFLRDEARFGVMLTVRPEEMALREALETAAVLRERLRIRCVGAILNGASRARFSGAELRALAPLRAQAGLAQRRNAIAEGTVRARAGLRAAGLAVVELPILFRPELAGRELEDLGGRLEAGLLGR
jgi:anion-transporting  ArsA/GET3 family ATPase